MNKTDFRPFGLIGRFFFTPTDPTNLGFMRILAGLLILYTHAVYTADLKTLMGPDAWLEQDLAKRQRRDTPIIRNNFGWEQPIPSIALDTSLPRRAAAIEFMRRLPESTQERERKLRYLRTAYENGPTYEGIDSTDPNAVPNVLYLAYKIALLTDIQRAKVEEILQKPDLDLKDSPISVFPVYVHRMTPSERMAFWNDAQEFNSILPPDSEQQAFLRGWLGYYPRERQKELLAFFNGTYKDEGQDLSLPADPTTRKEFLEYLETWAGDPRQALHLGLPIWSVWLHLTSPTVMYITHFSIMAIFVMFTLGLYTRTTSVLTWMGALFYIHRGQVYLFGQDTMQTILLFYLMIGPCGATLSLDALRSRYRASRAALSGNKAPWTEAILNGPQPSWLANFVLRMLQIHYCFIYGSSGLSKLKGPSWWDQSAAWKTMISPEFGLIRYRPYEWMIEYFADHRMLAAVFSTSIVFFTLFVEVGWMFLIWSRLRPLMIMCSAMLHTGITVFMGLTMFGLYMMALVCCYFPAALIRSRVTWPIGSGRKMTVRYDSRSSVGVKKAALIRAFDIAQQVTFTDTATTNKEVDSTATLLNPENRPSTGKALYDTALNELVLLRSVRLLGHFPGVWALVNKLASR